MTITITSPEDGSTITSGQTVHFACTISETYTSVVWKVYDGVSETELGTIGTTDSFDWVVPDTYSSYIALTIMVTVTYDSGETGSKWTYLWIQHTTPVVNIYYPQPAQELVKGEVCQLNGVYQGTEPVTITWQVFNADTGELIATPLSEEYDHISESYWTVPITPIGETANINVIVTATNSLGVATDTVACEIVDDVVPVPKFSTIPDSVVVGYQKQIYGWSEGGIASSWSYDLYKSDGTTLISHLSDTDDFLFTVPQVSTTDTPVVVIMKAVATNYVGSGTATAQFTVTQPAPVVNIIGLSDGDTVKTAGTYELSVENTGGIAVSYLWEVYSTDDVLLDTISTADTVEWVVPYKYYLDERSAVKLKLTVTNSAGSGTKTISLTIGNPDVMPTYVWKNSVSGDTLILQGWTYSDKAYHGYAVLRQGINGFSNDTKDIVSTRKLNDMGEFLQDYGWNRRDGFGFKIAILGNGRSEIDTKRRALISSLADGGALYIMFADGSSVHIDVEKAVVTVNDGLAVNPRVQYADISFIALTPYFYGQKVTKSGLSGDVTITNTGNVPAEVKFTLSANTITRTRGTEVKTISAVSGESLSGVVLTVEDNSVSAVSGTTNAMYKFTLDSDFFMLESGSNVVNGISGYEYMPRWNAI